MDQLQRLIKGKIPSEATGIEVRKSICTICDPATQCGLDCYVRDGHIIKVEGSKENPHSAGTLCAKGAAQRQWVYSEDRLHTPLKRVGPRGSGEMVPISWSEAWDAITENLQKAKAESGPESVVFYAGYPKHMRPFLQRLALQWGSPNFCTESSTCHAGMMMAWRLLYGQVGGPDLANAECLLVWTVNSMHSSTPLARRFMDARERGAKIIVVDPRISPMAGIADLHLRVRPGTDGALALAMANVIFSEGLHDKQFVSEWTQGFDEFADYVAEFTPQRAEEITGVPAALVREAAVTYATTKPAAVVSSAATLVHTTNGVQNQRAIAALVGLTGNFDVPGGNVVEAPGWLGTTGSGIITRQNEFQLPRPLSELPPRVGADRFPVWAEMSNEGQSMDLPRQLLTSDPYPLRAMVAFGLNYRMWPDSEGLLKALDKLDFIVDIDPMLTDSAKYADIALPACTSVERSELRLYPQPYAILAQPAIRPLGESRSDVEIICGLAAKLGVEDELLNPQGDAAGSFSPEGSPDFSAAHEAALDWLLEPTVLSVAELKKHPGGVAVDKDPIRYKKYEKKGFPTPSGKMELSSGILAKYSESLGATALPTYREPTYSPVSAPEVARDYPLILGAGTRLPMFIHSRTFRLPWARSLRPEAMADLNPEDADRLGIVQGDRIEVSSPFGAIEVLANVTELACPGVVHMFHDYPQANVNKLLSGDHLDPISGYPGFKASLCRVGRVETTVGGDVAPTSGQTEGVGR